MTTRDEDAARPADERDFRVLPPAPRLEDTVAGVEPDRLPDPEAGRNGEHHRALRDD